MDGRTQNALINRLDKLGIVHSKRKSNFSECQVLCISDENQGEDIMLTEYNYPASLNEDLLGDIIAWLDEKGYYFECEYSGTFYIVLEY